MLNATHYWITKIYKWIFPHFKVTKVICDFLIVFNKTYITERGRDVELLSKVITSMSLKW